MVEEMPSGTKENSSTDPGSFKHQFSASITECTSKNIMAKMLLKTHRKAKAEKKSRQCTSPIDVDKYKCKKKFREAKTWIAELGLSHTDRRIIASPTGWLNDKIMDGAQKLLRYVNPAVPGLQSVTLGVTCDFDIQTGEFLQVLHDGAGHWLVISTIGVKHPAEVYVYDSMYSSASPSLQMQIASLLHTEHSSIILNYRDVQRQTQGNNCGLFAIAFATSLVYVTEKIYPK